MPLMSGTGGIVTWARRGPGHTAETSTSTSHRNLSSMTGRLALSVAKKNPATKPTKGSRKPIKSKTFRERFQFDLIDFCKLRMRDPFGVLMHWILVIKDHATGFIYLCALPRK